MTTTKTSSDTLAILYGHGDLSTLEKYSTMMATWNIHEETQTKALPIKPSSSVVQDFCFSHNGSILATLLRDDSSSDDSSGNKVSLIHAPTKSIYENFTWNHASSNLSADDHYQPVNVSFGNKSRYLLVSERSKKSNKLSVLDVKKGGTVLRKFSSPVISSSVSAAANTSAVRQAGFDPTDTYIASMACDKLAMYNLKAGTLDYTCLPSGKGGEELFQNFQFSPHEHHLVAASTNRGSLHLYNIANKAVAVKAGNNNVNVGSSNVVQPYCSFRCKSNMDDSSSSVTDISFAPGNAKLASTCDTNGKVQFYDVTNQREVPGFQVDGGTSVMSMSFHQVEWKICAVGLGDGRVLLYDLRNLQRGPIRCTQCFGSNHNAKHQRGIVWKVRFPKSKSGMSVNKVGAAAAITKPVGQSMLKYYRPNVPLQSTYANEDLTKVDKTVIMTSSNDIHYPSIKSSPSRANKALSPISPPTISTVRSPFRGNAERSPSRRIQKTDGSPNALDSAPASSSSPQSQQSRQDEGAMYQSDNDDIRKGKVTKDITLQKEKEAISLGSPNFGPDLSPISKSSEFNLSPTLKYQFKVSSLSTVNTYKAKPSPAEKNGSLNNDLEKGTKSSVSPLLNNLKKDSRVYTNNYKHVASTQTIPAHQNSAHQSPDQLKGSEVANKVIITHFIFVISYETLTLV